MQTLPALYEFKVRSYENDYNNRLKISSVFNFMQIAAGLNANELGFGYDQFAPKGYFWVLSRVILEWFGNVKFDEFIIVETWPSGVERLFATRDFKLYSSNKTLLGRAKTAWLVIDSKTGRPVSVEKIEFPSLNLTIAPAIEIIPGKITEPEHKISIGSRKVVYSDIDVNHHVNNAKYMEYIFDALPPHLQGNEGGLKVQINYLKELKQDDNIEIFLSDPTGTESYYYIDANNQNGQKAFQCALWVAGKSGSDKIKRE